ncbi:MAG TPA: GNAT family N-acetyltransferase [Acholeplasmataceae bacterium]|jgi:GNAT superfamily N-acetyltransferase|nr:GNAT family N-acetyltransferase [Acholeplasmataceae bacterium]
MIRKATIKDAETIAKFNYLMAVETENLHLNKDILNQGVKAILSDPEKGIYFVYEKDNRIVGQLMITREWSDWRNGYFAWIQSVYVDQEYRNQNVFRSLFMYVKEMVGKSTEYCGLRLYVDKDNKRAQGVYQKLGMTESDYLMYEYEK